MAEILSIVSIALSVVLSAVVAYREYKTISLSCIEATGETLINSPIINSIEKVIPIATIENEFPIVTTLEKEILGLPKFLNINTLPTIQEIQANIAEHEIKKM